MWCGALLCSDEQAFVETIAQVHALEFIPPGVVLAGGSGSDGGCRSVCAAPRAEQEEPERAEQEEDRVLSSASSSCSSSSSGLLVLQALAYLSEAAPPQLVRALLSLFLHLR